MSYFVAPPILAEKSPRGDFSVMLRGMLQSPHQPSAALFDRDLQSFSEEAQEIDRELVEIEPQLAGEYEYKLPIE